MRATFLLLSLAAAGASRCAPDAAPPAETGRVGPLTFRLRSARTAEERRRAMGPEAGPAEGEGVLLVYPRSHFVHLDPSRLVAALDALFLGEDDSIVQIARFDPYLPEGATADRETRRVLLLPGGTANRHALASGMSLHSTEPLPDPVLEDEPALRVGNRTIRPMIAATSDARTRGLMYRPRMSEDDGMLFLYPEDRPLEFWMRNTRLPLSIAFLRSDGTILTLLEMAPLDDAPRYRSSGPAKYALEMNQGWFTRHGAKEGDRVEMPESIRSLRADP